MNKTQPKIIVIDDDPTGSQTVHSCLLLMQWDVNTLMQGLQDSAPIFFILSNTRAMNPEQAIATIQSICHNLKIAIAKAEIQDFLVVSRSDSTLRGHYPVETDVIAQELGGFDAHFLTPAFFEGGRITVDQTHYLLIDGVKTPVAETEFARDSVFGYSHSYLPDYVAEKTQGKIAPEQVVRFSLSDIRTGKIRSRLLELKHNQCVVVDGECQADFDLLAEAILQATAQGKRFLFRSAASLLTSLAQLGKQPIAAENMARYRPTERPGVVLVGSHVQKTTQQLNQLLKEQVVGIEVDVVALRDCPQAKTEILESVLAAVEKAFDQDQTAVIYTSRAELSFDDIQQRLEFGVAVSALLMEIVQGLPPTISFLISKGGITSNDVLSVGLNLTQARLLGQILPGCSVIRTEPTHPQFPNLPVVLFPGNVGDQHSLVATWQRLTIS
ncbi:Hrp-dependent type III effector protein [Pleurocapsa sp. CCALA 161]|uniref:four-carbon acid sugar kinase family protein n=1 Tax=Pleurocapsa sp. CCALA 161 TaxID=2107688 RepID=UPI000D06C43B|nr:four-carbon acid sugar kinase family protein [Pleurocapsa sp. CCALA 161]PSB11674.1 Hrp-dependent type III effector protein [Pleurocapsa sp. CCALA 161]